MNLKVLYEDSDIIVVVKPAGMPSQRDLSKDQDLYSGVIRYTNSETIGLVQRLDRPVGGILVMSKNNTANKALTSMVQEHLLDKRYMAVVEGKAEDEKSLSNYIQKVRGNRAVVSNRKGDRAKNAKLSYRMIDTIEKEKKVYSLIEVKLETGRFHQIRAQLAFNKIPIVGDTKYNPNYQRLKGWHDIGLYSYKLAFNHPISKKPMIFEDDTVWEKAPFNWFGGGR